MPKVARNKTNIYISWNYRQHSIWEHCVCLLSYKIQIPAQQKDTQNCAVLTSSEGRAYVVLTLSGLNFGLLEAKEKVLPMSHLVEINSSTYSKMKNWINVAALFKKSKKKISFLFWDIKIWNPDFKNWKSVLWSL